MTKTSLNNNSIAPTPYLIDVMSERQKVQFYVLIVLWIASQVVFWQWWMDSSHIVGITRHIVSSLVLGWTLLLPGYFFFFVARMKKPNPKLQISNNVRVAMVVTKAPSEPFTVVEKTLTAMLAQKHPHDTWLADEDPSVATLGWCAKNNVYVSSRKGISTYHCTEWPRRTKCKEGNLAYFYDTYGYENYDLVVQLDADHVPADNYLEEMLRPFANPEVGYVSAPSICDANKNVSWAVRARLYAEAIMHGALQAGYSNGWAPLCIGSHYAVRTKALKEIGGLGPELAEDHSTTLIMNAHGWKGVHAFDAEAHGDGPVSFADLMIQDFQWSRSLVTLLLTLTPTSIKTLPLKLTFQFIFSQLWYPLFGLTMLAAYLTPIIALITKTPWVNVSYASHAGYAVLPTLAVFTIIAWIKHHGWLRPKDAKIFSWEAALFQLARWPWVIWGTTTAAIGIIRQKQVEFRITPKGDNIVNALPIKTLIPYAAIATLYALATILIPNAGHASGYYYFAILNTLTYTIVVLVITARHIYEN